MKSIKLPFAGRSQSSWLKTSYTQESNAIVADAFAFDHIDNPRDGKNYISYDDGEATPPTTLKCIIIGSEKEYVTNSNMRKHYLVLVSRSARTDEATYERVGVGCILGEFTKLGSPVSIKIE